MSKISFQSAVQKLDDMISKRYDVHVAFISPNSSNPAEIVYFETVRRNSGAPLIVTYNTMLLPVRIEGSLVGAMRVAGISQLKPVDLSRIKETIELVLQENFVSQTLHPLDDVMAQIESNIIKFPKLLSDDLSAAQS